MINIQIRAYIRGAFHYHSLKILYPWGPLLEIQRGGHFQNHNMGPFFMIVNMRPNLELQRGQSNYELLYLWPTFRNYYLGLTQELKHSAPLIGIRDPLSVIIIQVHLQELQQGPTKELLYMGPTFKSHNMRLTFKIYNMGTTSIRITIWAHFYRNYNMASLFVIVNWDPPLGLTKWSHLLQL